MHIHRDMFAYANAGFEPQSMQTGAMLRPGAGGDWDGDADGSAGGANATGGAGGNAILQALAEALQSLGLSLESNSASSSTASASAPAAATPATASSAPTTSGTTTPVTDPTPGTPSAASTGAAASSGNAPVDFHQIHAIARDIRHVMRALFTGIQAENTLAPAASDASSATGSSPKSSFGSGLAALISQIQGGSIPANLANAFDKLVTDLEKIGGSSGASGAAPAAPTAATTAATPATVAAASSPTATSSPAATSGTGASASATTPSSAGAPGLSYQALLLQFLTNLQSDLGLGYGTSPAATAQGATSGLMVNTLA